MDRIIINYDEDIPTETAMKYVNAVISLGRMSGLNEESYCYCTKMKDKTMVFADVTKAGTDVFRVVKKE